jgi:hypothetical protein
MRQMVSKTNVRLVLSMTTIILGGFCILKPVHAEVTISKDDSNIDYLVNIFGQITRADADEIERHETDFTYRWDQLEVNLNSTGGDVDAAIRIGRLVRRNGGYVFVGSYGLFPNAKCYASCALIYIAGVSRSVSGTGMVGLYNPLPDLFESQKQENKESVLKTIRDYVSEMRIGDRFYEVMTSADPRIMKLYGHADMKSIVPVRDEAFDEKEIFYASREHGIDIAEMRSRMAMAERSCTDQQWYNRWDCAIKWGLSEKLYSERRSQAADCSYPFGGEITTELAKSKWNERRDHPLWLKYEACRRDIMLAR